MLSQVQAIRNITCRSAYEKCGSAHDRYVVTTVSLESVLYTDPEANMAAIEKMVDDVIAANPDKVAEYKGGKEKLLGWFVGQTMRASQGKANPAMLNELVKKKLDA